MMQRIPIRQIACGYDHTVILREDNDVFVYLEIIVMDNLD